ncbi:MAG TPA: ribosome biogenesis factor YjgA [Rhodanobacteraceae bacterium]|nr:ribosome biogenesis factor YjgA [Rhodanobacteraceae bacterium]
MSPSRSRNQTELDDREYGPSRTQQRREALEVLELAGQLVDLPPSKLARLALPDDVLTEVANVRRITAHVARKRQLAYLAKLMRRHGEEAFDTARAELGENRELQHQQTAALHRLEAQRERLLGEDGDAALTDLLGKHPGIDRQHLRSLIRQGRLEREQPNKPPKACRELFRLLKMLSELEVESD